MAWATYLTCRDAAAKQSIQAFPTLSVAAVVAESPDTFQLTSLEEVPHPYTALIPESAFDTLQASQVICSAKTSSDRPQDCKGQSGLQDDVLHRRLINRLVVVGERNERDVFQTPIGRMQGALLHANYIQALLDQRTVNQTSWIWKLIITFCFFILIEIVFYQKQYKPEVRLAICLICCFGLSVLIYAEVVLRWGFYFGVVPPSLVALVGKYMQTRLTPDETKTATPDETKTAPPDETKTAPTTS